MPDQNQSLIQQPVGQKKTNPEEGQNIFVMPEKYRNGASPMEKPVSQIAKTPPIKKKPQPVPIPPPLPSKQKLKKPVDKKGYRGLIIFGFIFLLILGGGGYFVLKTLPNHQTIPTVVNQPNIKPQPKPTNDNSESINKPVVKPSNPENPFPNGNHPGIDSDSDGLTDIEENLVYQTNPRLPDTDNDGFLDGNEVFHRYNPIALAPGTLLETGLVKVFKDDKQKYQIFYPSVWDIKNDNQVDSKNIIQITTGETITISVEPKKNGEDLKTWYQEQKKADQVFSIKTKNGLTTLVDDNQLEYYIDADDRVIHLIYDTSGQGSIDYLQTFQMMINSLELK